MKRKLILLVLLEACLLYSEEDHFFRELKEKKTATFNDAITIMRYVFKEPAVSSSFRENIVWAAEKKLFRVSIPININNVNPVITRKEFSNWLCKLFEIGGTNVPATKTGSYKRCVNLGIVHPGRGAGDSFSGLELIDTFSYFDFYIRSHRIKKRYRSLPLYDEHHEYLPDWRTKLWLEFEQQRQEEKEKLQLPKKPIQKQDSDDVDLKIVE